MTHRRPPRRTRIRRRRVAGLLVVVAAIAAATDHRLPASSSSPEILRSERPAPAGESAPPSRRPPATTGRLDNLDRALAGAVRRAAADAAADGVALHVKSGWRSPEHQERLLREAISKYGSEAEAARWVATPETSPHVSGDAVDVGPAAAIAWLSDHGARYGLCQIYGNEPWHYELRPQAAVQGCPAMYSDPTHDPRMRR